MKNTYINEQSLLNYPFAEGQALPFPRHAVSALHVVFRHTLRTASWSVDTITVSGVEIGKNVLTLALAVNDNVYIGRLSVASRSTGTLVSTVDGIQFHAMLETGNLQGIDPMSAACSLTLDPSCVLPCTWLHSDNEQNSLVINGYVYPIGECLDIRTAGALETQTRTELDQAQEHVNPSIVYADVDGLLQPGAGAFTNTQFGTYDMIKAINGIPVRGSADPATAPRLEFRVVPGDTEPAGTPTLSRIKFGLVNGIAPEKITTDPEDAGPDLVPLGFNDTVGNATIISVIGGPQIPNCYMSSDQSSRPDDPTINRI
jgi:hypothetical protein